MKTHVTRDFQATCARAGDAGSTGFRLPDSRTILTADELAARVDAWVGAGASGGNEQAEVYIAWAHLTEDDPAEAGGLDPEESLEPRGRTWSAAAFRHFLDREGRQMRDGDVLVVEVLERTHLG